MFCSYKCWAWILLTLRILAGRCEWLIHTTLKTCLSYDFSIMSRSLVPSREFLYDKQWTNNIIQFYTACVVLNNWLDRHRYWLWETKNQIGHSSPYHQSFHVHHIHLVTHVQSICDSRGLFINSIGKYPGDIPYLFPTFWGNSHRRIHSQLRKMIQLCPRYTLFSCCLDNYFLKFNWRNDFYLEKFLAIL